MSQRNLREWKFEFGLCATRAHQWVLETDCEELLELVIQWAEGKEYGVGGGYRPFSSEELEPGGGQDLH